MGEDDLRIAMAMLADRGLVRMIGVARIESEQSQAKSTDEPTDVEIDFPGLVDGVAYPSSVPITVSAVEAPAGEDERADALPAPAIPPLPGSSASPRKMSAEPPPPARPPPSSRSPGAQPAPPRGTPAPPGGPRSPAPSASKGKAEARPAGKIPLEVRLYEEAAKKELAGESEEAIALLRRAAKANPNAAPVHNRLGVLLALRQQEYREAVSCLMRAIELDSQNATYQSNLRKVMSRVSSGEGEGSATEKTSVGKALLGFLTRKR